MQMPKLTLIGVIGASLALTAGLLAAAAVTRAAGKTHLRSNYLSFASKLVSEKLDDLKGWDRNDPSACVPAGSKSVGSLIHDLIQTTTCVGGASDRVSYFDDITMGPKGSYSETISGMTGGTPAYVTTVHAADGSISISTSDIPPNEPVTFHRRWSVERISSNARRITVTVTLLDRAIQPGITLVASAVVRP